MKLYAERPSRVTSQLVGDVLVLCWVVLSVWLGRVVYGAVSDLAGPGRDAEQAGRSLQRSLTSAAKAAGDVPVAGDSLRQPFDRGASSGADLARAAQGYQDAVGRLALVAGLTVALVPILLVLTRWLPARLRWATEAVAARRLRDEGADADVFALRALAHQPLAALAKVAADPARAWRDGDPVAVGRLAALELRRLGMRPERQVPRTARSRAR